MFITALEAPSHFALTKRGAVLIAETLNRPLEAMRVVRGISKLPLRHHDGGVQLAAALHRGTRLSGAIALDTFEFETAIRRRLKVGASAQVPDAVAVLKACSGTGHRLAWAIEVDMASESPAYVAQRKGKPYADLKAQGAPLLTVSDWRVVCVVPTEQRLKRLVAALWDAGVPEGQWYFAIAGEVRAETVFSSAWRTVRTTSDGELAELTIEAPLPGQAVLTNCLNRHDGRGA